MRPLGWRAFWRVAINNPIFPFNFKHIWGSSSPPPTLFILVFQNDTAKQGFVQLVLLQ
jgi:hypothetical protein